MENEIIYNTIGKLIKKERKKKGITQEELALLTNYSLSFIANIESNTYQSFSIHTLYNIANALNISIYNLIPEEKDFIKDNYYLICKSCNNKIDIPREIAFSLEVLGNNLYTCPKCHKKKMSLHL